MRKLQWLLIVALVGACDDDDDFEDIVEDEFDIDADGIDDFDDNDIVVVNVDVWRANIDATFSGDAINGVGIVSQTIGEQSFTAAVRIRSDVSDAVRPWHVHFGTCATGGGIVGDDAAYRRLVMDNDGTATSSATIGVALDPRAPYHINIHESDAAFNTIIACGDLVLL